MKKLIALIFLTFLSINIASAIIVDSVDADTLAPGEEGIIRVEIENILNDDAQDVSLSLNFANLPFIPIGTSEQTTDEIEENDDETYVFTIKAANDITPGDYEIPYTLEYEIDDELKTRPGSIGIKVVSNPELVFSVSADKAIVERQSQITFKIINKGFSDARFVSIRVLPEDFTLLSDAEEYIGEIESDDFETTTFDVIFKKTDARFKAVVEYIDFDNKKIIIPIDLPLTVYSEERAKELGLTQKNNTVFIIGTVIAVILIWILWRIIKKRRRLRKSMQKE